MFAKSPAPAQLQPKSSPLGRAFGWVAKTIGKGVWKVLGWVLVSVFLGARWTLTGPRRHACAPFWLYGTAVVSGWLVGSAAWWWVSASAVLIASIHPPLSRWWERSERRVMSERERDLVGCTLACVALVVEFTTTPSSAAALLGVVVLAGAVPWWRGRRIRAEFPEYIQEWEEVVVPAFPDQLEGWWEPHGIDQAQRTALWRLASGKAADVVGLTADIEAYLRCPRGTIRLDDPPRLSRDLLQVSWPEEGNAGEIRLWSGPTLRRDGLYVAGYAYGTNQQLCNRLLRPRGACFTIAVGGPGSGKGVFMRIWVMECGLAEWVLLFVVDGKRGAGIPEARGFAYEYGTRPEEWLRVIRRVYAILISREERYGDAGKSRFRAGPQEPLVALGIDEGFTVVSSDPEIPFMLIAITGKGSSLGIHVFIDGQYGAAPTFGSVETRNNMLAYGTLWIGQQGDQHGKQAAKQDFNVNLDELPIDEGWAFLGSKVVDGQALVPSRGPFIASQYEVDEAIAAGDLPPPTPYGVCEDWKNQVVHPELHPADQAAAAKAGPPAGTPIVVENDAKGDDAAPDDEVMYVDGDVVALVPDWARSSTRKRPDGKDRVRSALMKADRELAVKEIAREAGLSERHTRDVLNALAEETPPAAVMGETGWTKGRKAS